MPVKFDAKPAFLRDLLTLPKKVQQRALRAIEVIEQDPLFGNGHAKKIFSHRYTNVYRYRLGDYRLIYCLGEGCAAGLAIGHRADIYDRFSVLPGDLAAGAVPDAQPIAIAPAPGIPPAVAEEPEQPALPLDDPEDDQLPPPDRTPGFFRELLAEWGVPAEHHDRILACQRLEDLLDLGLDDEIVERILHWQRPPTPQQIAEQPTLDVPSLADLERYLEGTLRGFLLKLDPEQEKVAYRIQKGAQLVKGGPGSGKSLVALYHIRHRIASAPTTPPRILFVTFTRALTRASSQLLDSLLGEQRRHVTVSTLDAVVREVLANAGAPFAVADEGQQEAALKAARQAVRPTLDELTGRALDAVPDSYLREEIEWVIEGRAVPDLAAYLAEPRAGRRVRFDGRLRRAVWEIARRFRDRLASQGVATYNTLRARAADALRDGRCSLQYDVVVVDEGQDLPPVALAVCAELCASPDGLYVTADANQSIYGRGYSWLRAHSSLNFQGRTTILRRNYRSTRAIAAAAASLMGGSDADADSLAATAVREGPPPVLAAVRNENEEARLIADYLTASADELRLPLSSAAILVRFERIGQDIAKRLRELNVDARVVHGDQLDLDAPFVKVLTMHSAKGLEFPIVVVPRIDRGVMPFLQGAVGPDARAERAADERRLLFVALTRAMRRLLVTHTQNAPSPFLNDLDRALWTSVAAGSR
ncbi:MAG: 3'-5' exonuclease [Chloroflexota bacterium]|nr:UvrD-helicase domain-containing protein [Dehalococcoidia bacterium]MDW8253855.1 3'-5' exonuclease [Chloroflexota bacterium]